MPERLNIATNTSIGENPSAYRLQEIILRTHSGREFDISDFVTDFKIVESLYTPYLRLEMNVKDNANLFEELRLSGQEKIEVSFEKEDIVIGRVNIARSFTVTDYPVYGKVHNRQQVYSIVAISETMFPAKFKQVSRAVSGEIKNIIRDLLINELGVRAENIELSNEQCSSFRGIIPNMTIYDAISWLLRRAYGANGCPYYCYETMLEGHKIIAHTDLIAASEVTHRVYDDGKFYTKDPANDPDSMYRQRLARILDLSSDLNMSKLVAGLSGAYGARTEYVDLFTKTGKYDEYDYSKEFSKMRWLDKYSTLSPTFLHESDTTKLSDYHRAAERFISLNSGAYDRGLNYSATTQNNMLNRSAAYLELFDTIKQTVTIHGDPTLYPGKTIELKLAQALDPAVDQQNVTNAGNHTRDEMLSGKYVVASIQHDFGAEYYCTMLCKRDSFSYNFEE